MKKWIILGLLSISFTALADVPQELFDAFAAQGTVNQSRMTTCICQIGQEPAVQKWFFKKGCKMWLKEQTECSEKIILDEGPKVEDGYKGLVLNPQFQNGHLKLGYVGHWGGGSESYNYFKETIVPTLKKYNVSISWDNTACSGLNQPEEVLKLIYLQSDYDFRNAQIMHDYEMESLQIKIKFSKILKEDTKVRENYIQQLEKLKANAPRPEPGFPVIYKANQVDSIGMWDRKIHEKSNLWAVVNFQTRQITYPECNEFEGQACTGLFQTGQGGKCRNTSGGLEELICCKQSAQTFQWTLKKDCGE